MLHPRSWRQIFLNVVRIAVVMPALQIGAAKAKPPATEWVLSQEFVDRGKFTVYIASDAVKLVNRDWGYQMLAKAPQWTIQCVRPVEKVEWIGEVDKFNGKMLLDPVANWTKNPTVVTAFGTGDLKGLKYTRFLPSRTSRSELHGADDIVTSPKGAEFLCRFFDCAVLTKVPIFYCQDKGANARVKKKGSLWLDTTKRYDQREGVVVELVTTAWRKQPYNAMDFQYLAGCTRDKSLTKISLSGSQLDDLTAALDNLGFANDKASAGKKSVPTK